ncbi:MAG: two-component system, OmpR family, response regulator ChvI [Rhodospirillaceae bacterium]|nr:two-component system, OmpR family, response regulator ChvI [Rhodospirillaceae bacterium]
MTAFEQDVVALDAGVPVLLASVSEPDTIRVLLIEDGVIDRGFLTDELSKQGFAVRKIASLTGAPHAARDADVVVLHCDCAKMSSIDLLVNLHRQGVKVPVVLLTGEAPPTDECLALDRGAVDVIRKSRGSDVLLRRLKRAVKASRRPDQLRPDGPMIWGKLLLRPDVSRVYWNAADLGLTLGEYNIVHLLASNAGRFMTYRAIYDRLHYEGFIAGSGADGYRANVRTLIRRIRSKFSSADPTFDEIENYAGFGYCWKKPD